MCENLDLFGDLVRNAGMSRKTALFLALFACGDSDPEFVFDGGPNIAMDGMVGCGNGALDPGEVCDGTVLDGATCESLGFGGGALGCAVACDAYDDSMCESAETCGNGVLDPGEVCDGELHTETCEGLGFAPGPLTCDRCALSDTSMCPCLPTTCEAEGANCGEIPDACGGTLVCTDPICDAEWLTCGGAGTPNRCGAECLSSCPEGSTCSELGVCSFIDPLVVDITYDMISFRFLVDGETPDDNAECSNPESTIGSGSAVNTSPFPGGVWSGSIRCGTNWTSDPAPLSPGRYRVSVQGRAGATNVPGILGQIEVDVAAGGPSVVDVNLPLPQIAGRLVIGGETPTETASCTPGALAATIELSARTDTIEIPVLCGTGFTFDTRLFHGNYEVSVRPSGGRSNLGNLTVELPELEVNAPMTGLELEVSDQSVEVSGAITWGSITPTATDECSPGREAARVTFFDRSGDFVAAGQVSCDGDFRYALRVLPGEYSVQVRGAFQQLTELPYFSHLVGTLNVSEDIAFDVDIPRRTYEGRVTVDGSPLSENELCLEGENAARLLIQRQFIDVRCGGGTYGPVDLVPADTPCGACETPTRSEEITALFPLEGVDIGAISARGLVDLQAPDPIDIDFVVSEETFDVEVSLTLDGAPAGEECTDGSVGQLALRNVETGQITTELVACGAEFSTTFDVSPGSYTIEGRGNEESEMPPFFRLEGVFVVDADTAFTGDVATRLISGQVLVNGALPMALDCDEGEGFILGLSESSQRLGVSPQIQLRFPCDGEELSNFGPLRLAVGLYTVSAGFEFFGVRRTGTNVPDYIYNFVGRFEVR
ncbi:MAG: hypothetical protein AB8H86_21730 [Polyangiales bacterium]